MASNGPPGAIARPAPPGRRRLPASRTVSSMSISSLGERRSPSPSVVASRSNALNEEVLTSGLYSSSSIELPPSEIPLEEIEKALSGLSREDLVLALKRAKEQLDILDTKMDVYIERNEILESKVSELSQQASQDQTEIESLQIALQQREERVDELMREQDREEDEVYAKEHTIERLRKRLAESEKTRIEAERRYHHQTSSADKERQMFSDMESLLRTQKTKASTAHERLLASNHEMTRENQRLQNLVLQLRSTSRGFSHSPDSITEDETPRYTPRAEIGGTEDFDMSQSDASLLDEHNHSFTNSHGIRSLQDEARALEVEALQAEFLALQKSHDMIQAQMHQLQTDLVMAKSANAELVEQNETYMDILQEKTFSGALIQESSMLNGRYLGSETEESEADEVDDVDDVPDEPRMNKRGKARLTAKRSQELQNVPTSLANELEKSDGPDSGRDSRKRERRRERSEVLTDNVEDLHKEIWNLRDANQALTLYVSKILDRIISREGYENVLAIDGDSKSKMGTLRSTPNRSRVQRNRPSAIETLSPPTKASKRASGIGLLAFMGGGGGEEANADIDVKTPTAASPSFVSRAKRGASMDWRSLVGASPTSPSNTFDNSSIATRIGLSATIPAPRKINSSEEVEDVNDAEEKQKIRQSMINHGLEVPDNQLKTQKRVSAIGTFFTRVIGASVTSSPSSTGIIRVDEDSASVVNKRDQHPAPRLTTFDGPPLAMQRSTSSGKDSDQNGSSSSSPISRSEARQRALDVGNSGSLTEVPRRDSPLSARLGNAKRREISSASSSNSANTSVGDTSRGESFGGDESFQYKSPVLDNDKRLEEEEEASTWGKTFKRMSLLGQRTDRS